MHATIRRFVHDENGATALEYGLLVAGLAVAIVVAVNLYGADIAQSLADIGDGASGEIATATSNATITPPNPS